jgi:preprotein translocase subunit SecE
MVTKIRKFIGEVVAEMKKVSWTKRAELVDSTLVVIFASLLLGVFVAAIDLIYSKGVTTILR